MKFLVALLLPLTLFITFSMVASDVTIQIPRRALGYRRTLVSNSRLVWGINAPVATISAQIHQESHYDPNARSKYAGGLAQFTPETAKDMARNYPKELGVVDVFEPGWALRAINLYDKQLYDTNGNAANDCERWAFTLSAYNGGLGNVRKQQRAAILAGDNPDAWFYHTERYRIRRADFHQENTLYPRKIIFDIQPAYTSWGIGVECLPL